MTTSSPKGPESGPISPCDGRRQYGKSSQERTQRRASEDRNLPKIVNGGVRSKRKRPRRVHEPPLRIVPPEQFVPCPNNGKPTCSNMRRLLEFYWSYQNTRYFCRGRIPLSDMTIKQVLNQGRTAMSPPDPSVIRTSKVDLKTLGALGKRKSRAYSPVPDAFVWTLTANSPKLHPSR